MKQDIIKYLLWFIIVIVLRIIPHPPNVEPIMTTTMPFAKKWGWLSGFIFSVLAILFYDVITWTLGTWTMVTASTYWFIGIMAWVFLKKRENKIFNYLIFAIIATLFYDIVTWIGMWVLLFNQDLVTTIIWQIPFTINHLIWNVILSCVLSPIIYRFILQNHIFEISYIKAYIKTKII
jgi:hypothetical protein